jgi:hypothetical protein
MMVLKMISVNLNDVLRRPSDSKALGMDSWTISPLPKNFLGYQNTPDGKIHLFYTEEEPDKGA